MNSRKICRRSVLVWAPVVLTLAACDVNDVASAESTKTMLPPKEKRQLQPQRSETTMKALIAAAQTDLMQRLEESQKQENQKLGLEDIKVLRATRVNWRSGALGCPQPDRAYKMVLVPGVLIELRAGETSYVYHSTLHGPPFICEPPGRIESPAPGNNSLDPT